MSDESDASDKEYDATPHKLSEARKKGEIPQSRDLLAAAAMAGLVLGLVGFGSLGAQRFGSAASSLLERADPFAQSLFANGSPALASLVWLGVSTAGPLVLLPMLAVLAMAAIQQIVVFVPSKIAPKMSRISPIEGAKNKFGRKGLFEFAKNTLKLGIVAVVLGAFLVLRLELIAGSLSVSPGGAVQIMLRLLTEFIVLVLIVQVVMGGVDYIFQFHEHQRKNRMSRKEVMDELKQSEGDPHMKAQRRQRGAEIASNQMLADVAKADVVIVNPTHYAVALQWSRKSRGAPVCLAKGVDEIAARIRERAAEHGVPVHSDPPTARALHASVEIGAEIPPETYRAVAAAIRFSEAMRLKARARGMPTRKQGL